MKSMIKDAGILFAITLIAGLVLGGVYQLTKEPIAQQEERARTAAMQEVFADAQQFVEPGGFSEEDVQKILDEGGFTGASVNECVMAADADGNALGYVITVTTHEGYGGDIRFAMGVRNDGTLNGMSILSIAETAGLGMRAEEVLKPQFTNKKVDSFVYTKTGAAAENEIDAISSATVTTSAVTEGVNAGLYYFRTQLQAPEGTEGGTGNE